MKKGFTLVEMLVVVVVIVTLMTIVFRIGGLGEDASARSNTIIAMQKLENALSGYYAAFGGYPAVRLHGKRNPFLKTDAFGVQNDDGDEDQNIWNWSRIGEANETKAWQQVRAACKAQPVDCNYPFAQNDGTEKMIETLSLEAQEWARKNPQNARSAALMNGFDNGVSKNIGRFNRMKNLTEWDECHIFRFGLLSYLLPRYFIMMDSDRSFYSEYLQWSENNALPCDPLTGMQLNSWEDLRRRATSGNASDYVRVANIPSQAASARWLVNFEGALKAPLNTTEISMLGVTLCNEGNKGYTALEVNLEEIEVWSPNGYGGGGGGAYVLDGLTIRDGWARDLYYYSPPPYQAYTLWSGGKNGRTFPPWISREALGSAANACIALWTADDIVSLKQ